MDAVREEQKRLRSELQERLKRERFDTPFGRWLKALLPFGVGVHHGGMLPKYRRLVEQLAADRLLLRIVGTDTLGIGVNLPIRTVVLTQLYKAVGDGTRLLDAREFQQVVGRAGRPGHDDVGYVMVQHPEHEIENARARAKAKGGRPKSPLKDAPRGFRGWSKDKVFKLVEAEPPHMKTRLRIDQPLVLKLLTRPGGGPEAVERLIEAAGLEPSEAEKRRAEAREIIESLLEKGTVVALEAPDEQGRRFQAPGDRRRGAERPLHSFLKDALLELSEADEDFALDVLSLVEATVDTSTRAILDAQVRAERQRIYDEWKALGDEQPPMEEMQDAQERVEAPAPHGLVGKKEGGT